MEPPSQVPLCATKLLLKTGLGAQWHSGSLTLPRTQTLHILLLGPQKLSRGDPPKGFPFREKSPKPAMWQSVCCSAGVILQESSPSTQGLACVFTRGDCEFLPCSGECHFPGTDRNLNLSNEYSANKSLDLCEKGNASFISLLFLQL